MEELLKTSEIQTRWLTQSYTVAFTSWPDESHGVVKNVLWLLCVSIFKMGNPYISKPAEIITLIWMQHGLFVFFVCSIWPKKDWTFMINGLLFCYIFILWSNTLDTLNILCIGLKLGTSCDRAWAESWEGQRNTHRPLKAKRTLVPLREEERRKTTETAIHGASLPVAAY